jgi:NAD(P)-dependent dehydrogenase (short-subunit alcohol dehydrogenase family)
LTVVIVTGASRGIGRATAERFAAEGAQVVVNHARDAERAGEVVAAIAAAGGAAVAVEADVSNPEQVDAMVTRVTRELGPIDVLVNNAGVSSNARIADLAVEEFDRVLAVNLRGTFLCCRAVCPAMTRRGSGTVVNVASELGLTGEIGFAHYCASKGGVIAMSKALARELAPDVRVNVVAPGPTETEMLMSKAVEYNPEKLEAIPLRRWGRPDDIAATICFLASPDASYYTGWVLSPNGGTVM